MSHITRFLPALLTAVAMLFPGIAAADLFPIIIPDFERDPSGPQFEIRPLLPSEIPDSNLAGPADLTYGVTSVPDGTENTLMMQWDAEVEDQPATAGWLLEFGEDPDIRNGQITLSINAPGGFRYV